MKRKRKGKNGVEEENWTWSPTQLKALDYCPYQFYLRYVEKVEADELPDEIKAGLEIHEEIFSDLENGTSKNPVTDIIRKRLSGKRVELEPEVVFEQVIDGVRTRIKGLPDIVTEDEIYDLKTTASYALDRVSSGDRIQMTLYRLATGKPTRIVKIPREGFPFVNIHDVELDHDFLKRLPSLIRLGRRILNGEVPKPDTSKCKYCFLKSVCPFGEEGGDDRGD